MILYPPPENKDRSELPKKHKLYTQRESGTYKPLTISNEILFYIEKYLEL